MPTEPGYKVKQCIDVVCRMHASVSKLLLDFDKVMDWPSTSVFGSFATKDLTYNVRARAWMPDGVFRYLSCRDNPKLVEAITVCFMEPRIEEPLLLVGRLLYVGDPIQDKSHLIGGSLPFKYMISKNN